MPVAKSLAFVDNLNGFSSSGILRIGAVVKACFSVSNAATYSGLHSQETSFLVNVVSDVTIFAKF